MDWKAGLANSCPRAWDKYTYLTMEDAYLTNSDPYEEYLASEKYY